MLFCTCEASGRDKSFCYKSCPYAGGPGREIERLYENIKTYKRGLKNETRPEVRNMVHELMAKSRAELQNYLRHYAKRKDFLELVWAEARERAAARGKEFRPPYGHLNALLRRGAPAPSVTEDSGQGHLGL